ncbi:MAG: primosomal protein N' [Clostridiales bacterium]|nr:primosomal protein N' [Clostridiales bacterium]
MDNMTIAEIAVENVAYHFDAAYSYAVPDDLLQLISRGCRVTVPFGNGNRKRQGICLNVCSGHSSDGKKLKSVAAVLDEAPLLNDEMLSLVGWLKERTFCTLFEAAKTLLPAGLGLELVPSYTAKANLTSEDFNGLSADEARLLCFLDKSGKYIKRKTLLSRLELPEDSKIPEQLCERGLVIPNFDAVRKVGDATVRNARIAVSEAEALDALGHLTAKQKSVFQLLIDIGSASVKEIAYLTGVTPAVVLALEKKGLVELFDNEIYRFPAEHISENGKKDDIKLTSEQQTAYEGLLRQYESEKPEASLLFGVTGSGKTSVFLKLIDRAVSDGLGTIIMVPEIALTPQMLSIFYKRYGKKVAVFHSALSMGERIDEWKRVKSGDALIALGTRSAVFAPFDRLGLIIMDEEQEGSYKSERSPRYHARDVAKFRCTQHNALMLLASATPSIETYKNAGDGRYSLYVLSERYGGAVLPEVITVDMSGCRDMISTTLYDAIEQCLMRHEQVILLINRRGYNTFVSCGSCGTVATCPHCSISLTYHRRNERLMCHYCGYSEPFTSVCKQCGQSGVRYSGYGTQRVEDELSRVFPGARILRMDTDTTMSRYSFEDNLNRFGSGEYDIMLGTQMVAKGLDFEKVTLVGVVSVDQQLYNDDYRSSERAFDLLTQVVGRSGRGGYKGTAIVQTAVPDNEVITVAAAQDYEAFFENELEIRRAMIYPPFCDICAVGFSGENEAQVKSASDVFFKLLKEKNLSDYNDIKLIALGPVPPRVSKVSNRFRYRLTLKCRNTKRFRAFMSELLTLFGKDTRFSAVSVYADFDPCNLT